MAILVRLLVLIARSMPRGQRVDVPQAGEDFRRRAHHIELMLRGFFEKRPSRWKLRKAEYDADEARQTWRKSELVKRYRGERALSLLGRAKYAAILALAIVLSPNQWAFAVGPYYVATTGSDAAAGTIGAPFLTVQKGVDTAVGGETVYIRGGAYAEGARVTKALTIMGYPGDSVPILTSTTIAGTGAQAGQQKFGVIWCTVAGQVVDGLWVRNYTANGTNSSGIALLGTTANPGITVRNCTVSGCTTGYGIRAYEANYPLIYNNLVNDNAVGISIETAAGINEQQRGTGSEIHNNEVRDNQRMVTLTVSPTTDDAGAIGINLLRVTGSAGTPIKVYSNVIHGNHAWSYDYGYDGSGTEIFGSAYIDIYDNVYYDNPHHAETGTQNGGSGGIGPYNGIPYPVSDVRWYRNLFYRGTNIPVYDWRPAGTQWKTAAQVATTINKTFATGFANGQTVDGQTLVTGQRLLIKDQTTGSQNGLWLVPASGPPVTRVTDADTGAELLVAACYVTAGTVNHDTIWYCSTPAVITPDTTALTFVKITPYVSQFNATGYCNGILMAVGDNMRIVKNTFYNHDQTAISVSDSSGDPYAGSFTGFICEDNIFSGSTTTASWASFQTGRDMPSATVDYNWYQAGIASGVFMKTYGSYTGTKGSFTSVATIISNTPYEDHALSGDPLFISAGTDFRLQSTSTAINAGTILSPFTDGYIGPGPDMGYYDTTTGSPPQVPGGAHRFGRRNQIR